jgi:hypothetical protein
MLSHSWLLGTNNINRLAVLLSNLGRLDLALGQVPVPDQPIAARGISLTGMGGEERIQLRLDRLRDQFPRALAQQIRQRVR